MDSARRSLIEQLHAADCRGVFVVTGGGANACADLLAVAGASRTVLEVLVPYKTTALVDFLGMSPEQFCSADTAHAMADRALSRARRLGEDTGPLVGVACTATLATDRPKRGDHRFFLALHTTAETLLLSLTLFKGARDRAGEELLLGNLMLNAFAELAGVSGRLPVHLVDSESVVEVRVPNGLLGQFLAGQLDTVCQLADGRIITGPAPKAMLPGSFNPLHDGHMGMAKAAEKVLGVPIDFELSIRNVDKPDLSADEVRRRLRQFEGKATVWLSRAPKFDRKAELFPGTAFVVGADTARRLFDARYHDNDPAGPGRSLVGIRKRGCRFAVAGRIDGEGTFVGLAGLGVPAEHAEMFVDLPEFRLDLSSTQLRARSPLTPQPPLPQGEKG